jgi:hypothetical protein
VAKSLPLQQDRGGPVNLRGIHYQLLSTFRELDSAVRIVSHDNDNGPLTSVTLVVEPRGGGDSAIIYGAVRRVQQIKTHTGVWTLAQLVSRVFPDLFRAYCNDPGVDAVELVTSGQLDEQTQGLCAMLKANSERRAKGKKDLEQQAVAEDDLLPWFRGTARSSKKAAPRTLGDLIEYLTKRLPNIAAAEPTNDVLHLERVKSFLGRLSLRAGLSFEDQENQCREFLENWGIAPEAVPAAIDQVVGYLLRRGHPGNQAVTFGDLALSLRLAHRDLSDWSFLSALSRERLLADLARPRPGYHQDQDVRQSDPLIPELLRPTTQPRANQLGESFDSPELFSARLWPIVVWGKSGIGKTWLLARSAEHLAKTKYTPTSPGPAILWMSSQQAPRADLQAAAERFCHRVWGREQLPMELLAHQVNRAVGTRSIPWLVVFIDGVQSQSYLDRLTELPHGELGILLVVAVTAQFEGDSPALPGLRLLKAPGFNPDEVLRFLERHTAISRGIPPADVRRLLETPIFAAFYAALKQDGAIWQPEDEYGLVQRFWLKRIAGPRPQAADVLARLSFMRLRDAASTNNRPSQGYLSWTVAELTDTGLSQEDLNLLEGSAILVRDVWSRSYSFAHERILQWAAAEGALRAFQARTFQAEELTEICTAILTGESQARWTFSYVPADLLWLLLDPDLPEPCRLAAEALLAQLEQHHDFSRLEDWLTTLGPRLVSLLFARLRSADPEHGSMLYTYRDALKKIPGAEVAEHAAKLLAEPSLELQEIGAQLLGEREYPPALDALWALYQNWWVAAHSKRSPDLGRREGPWMHHVSIGEKALRRSVRNRPEWLEHRLLDSENLGGSNSTLLFLLASTPKGEVIWRRHKEFLRSRLADDQQRGFVRCIISFRDVDEVSWLESKVNETQGLVAPSARGALALLAPESALAQVNPEALLDLSLARGWWLPLAWIQKPSEAARFLKNLILESEDPIMTVFSFSGFELWYPPEVIDFLFETVQRELTALKEGRAEPGKDLLYAPLLRLSDCNTVDQLELFWNPCRQQLESDLADWLASKGSNDTGWMRHGSEEEAGEVLKLMAGSSMARVGSGILKHAMTWTGGRDGLYFAVREPDAEARAAIRRKAVDPTLSNPPRETQYPILQRFCVEALAYLRDFEGFAYGVVQWGLQLPPDTVAYLDDHRGAPELLKVAKEFLEKDPIPPGAFLLLGFHGGTEALDCLRMQGSHSFESSDQEVGWILGLDYSMDCSNETLAVFAKGLSSSDDRIHFSSWQALRHRIENPTAQELLLSAIDGGHKDSARLTANLLDTQTLKRAVAERLWQRVKDYQSLFNFGGQLEDFAVLGTDEVKKFLLDKATGALDPMAPEARHSAIRGLALLNRELALRAVLACQKGERSSEDTDWPALLVEVGGPEAFPHIRVELAEGRDIIRIHVLGEALRAERQLSILLNWLQDGDSRIREGACYAACAQAYDPHLEQSVLRCCLDPEEDVRTAAQAAFDRLWKDREVGRLIERLHVEPRSGRRWALIDSALAIGYPGVRPGFGQISWFRELIRNLPYYEVEYSVDLLKESRKELIERLKSGSRDFREDT